MEELSIKFWSAGLPGEELHMEDGELFPLLKELGRGLIKRALEKEESGTKEE